MRMKTNYEKVRVQKGDFSADEEVKKAKLSSKNIGGIVIFLGTAREFSKGKNIEKLYFEHYPGMAEKKLEEIRKKAVRKFKLIDARIIHRYGEIKIGENIVLILAAGEHREEAFKACKWLIDELKKVVPIWKKEVTKDGEVWVEEHP